MVWVDVSSTPVRSPSVVSAMRDSFYWRVGIAASSSTVWWKGSAVSANAVRRIVWQARISVARGARSRYPGVGLWSLFGAGQGEGEPGLLAL